MEVQVLNKLFVLLAMLLWANVCGASDSQKKTAGDQMLDRVVLKMAAEESRTAEDRLKFLRKTFIKTTKDELDNCPECKADFPDSGKEEFDNAADIYINDLKEREKK